MSSMSPYAVDGRAYIFVIMSIYVKRVEQVHGESDIFYCPTPGHWTLSDNKTAVQPVLEFIADFAHRVMRAPLEKL